MRFEKHARNHRQIRNGFTLIELMVVLAVIGMLMALLLPAVQSVRESARSMQCKNQMHQLGLALHAFESQNQTLPAGNDSANANRHSWCTRILPFIDRASLYNSYDWAKPWDDASGPAGMRNSTVTQTTIPLFCALLSQCQTAQRPLMAAILVPRGPVYQLVTVPATGGNQGL